MQAVMVKMQTFLRKGNQQVDGYGKELIQAREVLDLVIAIRRSHQDQTETPNSASKSLPYDVLMCKRWDTTGAPKHHEQPPVAPRI